MPGKPQAQIYTTSNTAVVQFPLSVTVRKIDTAIARHRSPITGLIVTRTQRTVTMVDPRREVAARALLKEVEDFASALDCTTKVIPPPRSRK